MLEKGKISAFQMGVILYPAVLGTGFLALPTLTAQYAKNDLWLTGILASFIGFIAVYMATQLHKLYPNMSVIQYSEHILGKIPGKLVGFIFFIVNLHMSGIITRQYAEFVTGSFLFKTPILLVISFMILLCAFAVRGGMEVLARCAVIFTPMFTLPMFILLLLIPDLDIKYIFPVLSHGMIPVLKGTLTPQAWVAEFFLMSFFLPFLSNPEKGREWGFISLSMVILTLTYVSLLTLFLLGPDTGNKVYPILIAFRYISFGNIFENMEVLLLAMWVVGNFIKIAVFFYVTALSLGQWLNLSDYRPVVFPIGIQIVALTLWDIPDFTRLAEHLKYVGPYFIPSVYTCIPLVLLIAAVLRKRKAADEGG
ncbi:MAG: spore gernimation protein [Paenibacillus sp.]|nr:spore gernimation protein [Paenibacillus sp.]